MLNETISIVSVLLTVIVGGFKLLDLKWRGGGPHFCTIMWRFVISTTGCVQNCVWNSCQLFENSCFSLFNKLKCWNDQNFCIRYVSLVVDVTQLNSVLWTTSGRTQTRLWASVISKRGLTYKAVYSKASKKFDNEVFIYQFTPLSLINTLAQCVILAWQIAHSCFHNMRIKADTYLV